jgi:hypothetical protein
VAAQTPQTGIDLLYAKTAVAYSKTSGAVSLPFTHQLVKLNMSVLVGNGISDLNGLTVAIKGMNTAATFNLSDGSGLGAQSVPADITPHDAGSYAYEAILLPVSSLGDSHKVEFTLGGNTYTWKMADDISGGLTGGYKYTYTISVNKTDINVHGTISPWGEGGTHTGEATPSLLPSSLSLKGLPAGTTVTLSYADGIAEPPFTLVSAGEAITLSPANIGKTIKSIRLNGGNPVLIGRKNDGSDVYLKFDDAGNLLLRDAGDEAIPIGSYAEFQLINTDHTRRAGTYRQEADLDLMNEDWTPIGNPGVFTGKFDGGGYTLSNLSVTGSHDGAGLFGTVFDQYTVLSNIHIVSGSVSGGIGTGGVCGVFPGGRITGCSNAADVSGLNGVGGICGNNQGAVTACYNTGNITASGSVAGGVCGLNVMGTITACYNTGNIAASTSYAGGVCAMNQGSTGTGLLTACYNTGSVVSPSIAGGVCGGNTGTITSCYWRDVPGDDAAYGISNPTGTNLNAEVFSSSNWPFAINHTEWGIGNGSGSGTYWKSLGSWNNGTPVFPKLWHE